MTVCRCHRYCSKCKSSVPSGQMRHGHIVTSTACEPTPASGTRAQIYGHGASTRPHENVTVELQCAHRAASGHRLLSSFKTCGLTMLNLELGGPGSFVFIQIQLNISRNLNSPARSCQHRFASSYLVSRRHLKVL